MLLFYLLPISLAVWFGSFLIGLGIVVASVVAWLVSDLAAGIPALRYWNGGMAFTAYALFAGVLAKLRTLVKELDRRVQERTAALQREVVERQRLDREIAQVADRERRRLGQDLHDHLGQHLTGTALAAQVLKEKLAAKCAPEVTDAGKLVNYVEEGIDVTRNLARGFFSPELEADGLTYSLGGPRGEHKRTICGKLYFSWRRIYSSPRFYGCNTALSDCSGSRYKRRETRCCRAGRYSRYCKGFRTYSRNYR